MLRLILVIVAIVLIALLLLIAIFYDDLKDISERRNHKKHVYKVLHYYAEENDQLLLNNVAICMAGENTITDIDHILICDKYVYVFKDYYAKGGIYGNVVDETLFLKNFKGGIKKIENPVTQNQQILRKLENTIGSSEDEKLFVSVVVFNSSLIVPKNLAIKNQNSWFLPVNEIEGTLKVAEEDDVPLISEEMGERLAKRLKNRSEETKIERARLEGKEALSKRK